MTEADPVDDSVFPKRSPDQLLAEFRRLLEEMEETPPELAKRMHGLGDHRSVAAILRSIQRMASGETGVSGEMLVIARMLVHRQRLLRTQYANLDWKRRPDGRVYAVIGNLFEINLVPQTRGRWLVNVEHLPTRFSPPWPVWQESLDAAKRKAITLLGDAELHIMLNQLEVQEGRQ
ncbi:hypothetical protein [Azospirillum soli]|uniref:hypothetical protein n=1 Tax=Azospirillum soli TaxID=1304799 RepID=UPI001AE4844B|nr:hypothetical protein [Azospirillum soli]MBP2315508.1 hypothetical protein [Azospirillum soli]